MRCLSSCTFVSLFFNQRFPTEKKCPVSIHQFHPVEDLQVRAKHTYIREFINECFLLAPDSNMASGGMAHISRERPIQHRQMESPDAGLQVNLAKSLILID